MIVSCRDVVLLANATATASGTGFDMVMPQAYTGAIVTLACSATSGTTPTLNVYVQNKLKQAASADLAGGEPPTGTSIYDDLISFTQLTGTGTQVARIVAGGNNIAANKDAALAAGSIASGPIGSVWRVKYVITGTSPSFTFNVVCQFIP